MLNENTTNEAAESEVYFISGLNNVAIDTDGAEQIVAAEISANEYILMAKSSTGVNVAIVSDIKAPVSATENDKVQRQLNNAAELYDSYDIAFLVQDLNDNIVPIFINEFGDDMQDDATTAVVNGYFRIDSVDEYEDILGDVIDQDVFSDMLFNIGVVFG